MSRSEDALRILAEWFDRRNDADTPNPEELLREHPDLADELRDGLAGFGVLEIPAEDSAPTAPSAVPDTLGDYRIVREIGRGGMGVVYEAEQISMDRRVALKVLTPTLTGARRSVQRFEREAKAAGRLHHTNIVPVYAMGQDAGYWYYAMELVQGRSLSQLLHELGQQSREHRSRHGLELLASSTESVDHEPESSGRNGGSSPGSQSDAVWFQRVAEVFAGVADALHLAHEDGVIHRDVKPGNLLLDADGTLKIVDFGLAHLDAPGPSMTLTGDLVGTPAYMSPEQAMARRIALDHRTDIYSLGATLYEALTLHPPFDGDTLQALCSQIITKDPALPRRLDDRIPRDLETIVLKAMEKDRDKRYQRAADLAADLRRFASGHLIRARRVGALERGWRKVKRHKVVASLSAALLIATVAGWVLAGHAAKERGLRLTAAYDLALVEAQREFTVAFLDQSSAAATTPADSDETATREAATEAEASDRSSDPPASGDLERILGDAIAIDPDRPEAFWLRALISERPAETRLADVEAARARGLPDTAAAYLHRSILRPGERENPPAETLAEPRTPIACFAKALTLRRSSERDEAAALLTAAIQGSKAGEAVHTLARAERARLAAKADRHRDALRDWLAIDGAGNRSAVLDAEIAATWRRLGDEEAAGERFASARAKVAPDPEARAWLRVWQALQPRDNLDWGEQLADLALDRHPEAAELMCGLAGRFSSLAATTKQPERQRCWERSRELCERALEIEPESRTTLSRRTFVVWNLFRLGAVTEQEVLGAFDAHDERYPDDVKVLTRRALFRNDARDYDDAVLVWDRILAVDPDHPHAVRSRLRSLLMAERYEEVLVDAGRVLDGSTPDDEDPDVRGERRLVLWSRGEAFMHLDRFEEAARDLDTAFHGTGGGLLMGGWTQIGINYGFVLSQLGRKEEAVEQLRLVLERAPDKPLALHNFAVNMRELDREAEGLAVLRDAAERFPDDPDVRAVYGLQLMLAGDKAAAADHCRRAFELGLSDQTRLLHLADCLKGYGHPELAIRALERLIDLHGDDSSNRDKLPNWWYVLGAERLRVDRNTEAYVAFVRAMELGWEVDLYNPACAAIRCSRAAQPELPSPAELRAQALEWLRAVLARGREANATERAQSQALQPRHWLRDIDLAPVRDPELLDRLPADEREAWQALWRDVAAWQAEVGAIAEDANEPSPTAEPESSAERVAELIGRGEAAVAAWNRDAAIAAYRSATEIEPDNPALWVELSIGLYFAGRYREALEAYERAIAARDAAPQAQFTDPTNRLPRHPNAAWHEKIRRMAAAEPRLLHILDGEATAESRPELRDAIWTAYRRSRFARAAALWEQLLEPVHALRGDRALFDSSGSQDRGIARRVENRYQAACAATLGGFGIGRDAETPEQRRVLRDQALGWLRANLDHWQAEIDSGDSLARTKAIERLRYWRSDKDLECSRDPRELDALPEDEARAWRTLWRAVVQASRPSR